MYDQGIKTYQGVASTIRLPPQRILPKNFETRFIFREIVVLSYVVMYG